ncbi:NYN domain-containing protein [Thermogemmatispora sp.]|uniref:NYN domain-containing protein n=1 Tax=Thermogemmatispora sp. TaxID=1968838 RepID=UPI0035E45219
MPEEIALFIDFENIRYSMLNIQRREPDPQELIAVARRYGTVMVARAYADWSRQPELFKGSLTAAMIDRVDCPAKQRDRIRIGTIHYPPGNPSTGALGVPGYASEGPYQRQWSAGGSAHSGHTGPFPAVQPHQENGWSGYQQDQAASRADIESRSSSDEDTAYQPVPRQGFPYTSPHGQPPSGPLSHHHGGSGSGPLGYSHQQHSGGTGHLPAIGPGTNAIVQSTIVQSTVDLNMLMDIIETVFDRPSISTFVLMTGDKDFTRICARLKLRLNKTVIVVGIPGTVSRDLISSANQFVPLVPGIASTSATNTGSGYVPAVSSGSTGHMPAVHPGTNPHMPAVNAQPPIDVLDPQFLQFLDYIDRNWSWRTVMGVANFIGDPLNPKNRFRGRLTRESARELLHACIQRGILLVQTDATGAEDLRLNRSHPEVEEVLKQFVR